DAAFLVDRHAVTCRRSDAADETGGEGGRGRAGRADRRVHAETAADGGAQGRAVELRGRAVRGEHAEIRGGGRAALGQGEWGQKGTGKQGELVHWLMGCGAGE